MKFFIVTTTHMYNNKKYREIYFEFIENEFFFVMFVFYNDFILNIEIEIFENIWNESIFVIFVFVVV